MTTILKDYEESLTQSIPNFELGAEIAFTIPSTFLAVETKAKGIGIGGVVLWGGESLIEHAILLLNDILFKTGDRYNMDRSVIELFVDAEYIHTLHEERTKTAVLTTTDLNAMFHYLFDMFVDAVQALYEAWTLLHIFPFEGGCYVKCIRVEGRTATLRIHANDQPKLDRHTPRDTIDVEEANQLSDS